MHAPCQKIDQSELRHIVVFLANEPNGFSSAPRPQVVVPSWSIVVNTIVTMHHIASSKVVSNGVTTFLFDLTRADLFF